MLAVSGIYGVLSYTVAQRTAELGIRLAIGASARQLAVLVVSHGSRIAVLGVGAGVIGSLLLGGMLSSLLYGITPADPLVLTGVAVSVFVIATAAAVVPAIRAARLDPVSAIRAG